MYHTLSCISQKVKPPFANPVTYTMLHSIQYHIHWLYDSTFYGCFSRLFLTMNSKYGEISRAMRNRGIELFILPEVRTVVTQSTEPC